MAQKDYTAERDDYMTPPKIYKTLLSIAEKWVKHAVNRVKEVREVSVYAVNPSQKIMIAVFSKSAARIADNWNFYSWFNTVAFRGGGK